MNTNTKTVSIILLLSVYVPLLLFGTVAFAIVYTNRHDMDTFTSIVLGAISLGTVSWSFFKGGSDILDTVHGNK